MNKKGANNFIILRGYRDYNLYTNDIQQENKKSCRLFLIANLITQAAVMISRLALLKDIYLIIFSIVGTVYSLILLFTFPKIINRVASKWIIPLFYLIQIPTFIISILNGSVFIRGSYAFSFYILSFILPLFIFDIPLRVIIIQTIYCIIFLIVDYFYKPLEIFAVDAVHLLVTYSAIVSAILLILSIRFTNLENYISAREKSEHQEVTGLKNRYALKKIYRSFFNKEIIVSMVDIDDFKFFNDMYGHQTGDIVLKSLGKILLNNFGVDACFSYGGDEFLIVWEDNDKAKFNNLMLKVKEELKDLEVSNTILLHPTISVGFVYGKPQSKQEFQNMVNCADFTLYNAKDQGKDIICDRSYELKDDYSSFINGKREIKSSPNLDNLTKLITFQSYLLNGQHYIQELKKKKNVLVCHINILNFNIYNCTNDYQIGDSLLIKTAELLKKSFPSGLITRISADHFSLVCEENNFETIFKEIEIEFSSYVNNQAIRIIAGCILLSGNIDLRQADDLAKIACDNVKKHPEHSYLFYDEALSKKKENDQWIISSFHNALINHDIVVYYQPIIQTLSSSISSLEALARWKQPTKGLVPPLDFIPVLENNRLIYKLDLYVLEEVCKQDRILMDANKYVLPVSINLSRYDFEKPDLVDNIVRIVDKYKIPHELIILEITESAFLAEKDRLKNALLKLKEQAFKIWMDDFGSEYSSLNLLKEFFFDAIKLDMKFLPSEKEKEKGRIIINSIIEMAQKLSIQTLTEGVEKEDDYLFLKDIGCEYIQGYLVSKPLEINKLNTFLESKKSSIPSSKEEIEYYQKLVDMSFSNIELNGKKIDLSKEFDEVSIAICEFKDEKLRILKTDSRFRKLINIHEKDEMIDNNVFSSYWERIDKKFIKAFDDSKTNDCWVKKEIINDKKEEKRYIYLHPISQNPTTHAESYIVLVEILPKEKDKQLPSD